MNASDKPEFDTLLEQLCATYDKPCGDARKSAYWQGLAKMGLGQFARVVEFCATEEGPDKLPIVNVVWQVHRKLRSRSGTHAAPAVAALLEDKLETYGNRLMLKHVIHRGGVGPHELEQVYAAKIQLHQFFRDLVVEEDPAATPREYTIRWLGMLRRIGEVTPQTVAAYQKSMEEPTNGIVMLPRDLAMSA